MQRDDDSGQVDGDGGAGPVNPFATTMQAQPWLRGGLQPWHMWGNSQIVDLRASFSDTPAVVFQGQLAKVAYKRPETWHWIFSARILDAPALNPGNDAQIAVVFDVIAGLGRSQVQMLTFDRFSWAWQGAPLPLGGPAPFAHVMWATSALTPALGYRLGAGNIFEPDPTTRREVRQIVAQDIQVTCRVTLDMAGTGSVGDKTTARVEVSAFLAPKTHVRPDWYQNTDGTPLESQFPGEELQGR